MQISHEKLIRVIRLMLGVVIAFGISWYYSIPDDAWIFVSLTVISVEQVTIGGVINRGVLRILLTILSVIYCILIMWIFNNNYVMNVIGLLFGIFVYILIYFGTPKGSIGTLGSITMVIILINNNNMTDAFMRPFNILLGIILCIFLNCTFYPNRATGLILIEFKNIIKELTRILHKL